MNNGKGLTFKAQKILTEYAQEEARKFSSQKVEPEHIFLALIRDAQSIAVKILERLDINLEKVKYAVENDLKTGESVLKMGEISHSPRVETVLNLSAEESKILHHHYIGTEHLLIGIFKEEQGKVGVYLGEYDVTIELLRQTIISILGYGNQKNNTQKKNFSKNKKAVKTNVLDSFSKDLTLLAQQKKLDPVIGRDQEIHRLIQILSRRTKNNPILIGEPGVGKSAIVEGLANSISDGEVPDILLNKRVVSLDLASCIAGTKYRGEFEERIKNIVNEIKKAGNIIIFIDEVHTIIGTGGAEGSMDASNILKPGLSRGELQCIGATTLNEYKKYIERDTALSRRFQKISVDEPTITNAIHILEGLKSRYEHYHNVTYPKPLIETVVRYSKRYLGDRFLPDSAIDLIDEAGSKVKLLNSNKPNFIKEIELEIKKLNEEKNAVVSQQEFEKAAVLRDKIKQKKNELVLRSEKWENDQKKKKIEVTQEDIALVVENITKIPVTKLEKNESRRLLEMEKILKEKIIGQNNAVEIISKSYRRARAGIKSSHKPVGSFMFLGPTGVGKSELAKRLAEFIFGTKDALIKIDMSEFMEKHTISRLIGAPPGYVGYQEGGQLTDFVRQKPYSVILLDEIEKAHPDIFNILLQILEDGFLSDHLGHKVDFSNTMVIMTSNLGSKEIVNKSSLGFRQGSEEDNYEALKNTVMEEVKRYFSPELINRVDDLIIFKPLSEDSLISILDIFIDELEASLLEKKLKLSLSKEVKQKMIEKGYNKQYGARPMRRVIQKEIEELLADGIIKEEIKDGDTVKFSLKKDKICFSVDPLVQAKVQAKSLAKTSTKKATKKKKMTEKKTTAIKTPPSPKGSSKGPSKGSSNGRSGRSKKPLKKV